MCMFIFDVISYLIDIILATVLFLSLTMWGQIKVSLPLSKHYCIFWPHYLYPFLTLHSSSANVLYLFSKQLLIYIVPIFVTNSFFSPPLPSLLCYSLCILSSIFSSLSPPYPTFYLFPPTSPIYYFICCSSRFLFIYSPYCCNILHPTSVLLLDHSSFFTSTFRHQFSISFSHQHFCMSQC